MRRVTVVLATLCLTASQLVVAGTAAGAKSIPVHRITADAGHDVHRGQIGLGRDRQE